MVTTKHCAHGTCNSDSRYADRPHMQGITFFRFPDKQVLPTKTKRWIDACKRQGFTFESVKSTRGRFMCSKHFYGGKGPTKEHPDPILATASEQQESEKLKSSVTPSVTKGRRKRKMMSPTANDLRKIAPKITKLGSICSTVSTSTPTDSVPSMATVPAERLAGKLVIGSKDAPLLDLNTVIQMLKLPPNLIFKINATKTTVVNRPKDIWTYGTNAEPLTTQSARQEGEELIIPEPITDNSQDYLKMEPVDSQESGSNPEELLTPDSVAQPEVEMIFECEEENIQTESLDSDNSEKFHNLQDISSEDQKADNQEETPFLAMTLRKCAAAKDHAYIRQTRT